ncbi:MAG: EAL and HDOD domain-containing protein [Thiohalospira sp.]
MTDVLVGRQPIYRRNLDVYAYELLFRGHNDNEAGVTDGDRATSEVLYNTFVEIGVDEIVGRHRAFVNLTPAFLTGDYPLPTTEGQLVLEILEDTPVTEEIVRAVAHLRARGYTIALDDFVYQPHLEPLVRQADIIKIDLMQLEEGQLEEHVARLSGNGTRLLAEKVETHEEFHHCRELGFDLFQGFFFCKPEVVRGNHLPTNRVAVAELLAALQDPEVELATLERLISRDVTLSYRLLRLINSAYFNLRREVDSVGRALMLLGLDSVRNWATLLTLSSVEDKPTELVRTAVVRARLCRNLGAEADPDTGSDLYFTVGLFSTLDALLDRPLETVLEQLPLSRPVAAALLERGGTPGAVLDCALAYEQGDWKAVENNTCGISPGAVRDAYLEAVHWADDLMRELVT